MGIHIYICICELPSVRRRLWVEIIRKQIGINAHQTTMIRYYLPCTRTVRKTLHVYMEVRRHNTSQNIYKVGRLFVFENIYYILSKKFPSNFQIFNDSISRHFIILEVIFHRQMFHAYIYQFFFGTDLNKYILLQM